jgi:hypothetical protein
LGKLARAAQIALFGRSASDQGDNWVVDHNDASSRACH